MCAPRFRSDASRGAIKAWCSRGGTGVSALSNQSGALRLAGMRNRWRDACIRVPGLALLELLSTALRHALGVARYGKRDARPPRLGASAKRSSPIIWRAPHAISVDPEAGSGRQRSVGDQGSGHRPKRRIRQTACKPISGSLRESARAPTRFGYLPPLPPCLSRRFPIASFLAEQRGPENVPRLPRRSHEPSRSSRTPRVFDPY